MLSALQHTLLSFCKDWIAAFAGLWCAKGKRVVSKSLIYKGYGDFGILSAY
jgi:hypothetical protein